MNSICLVLSGGGARGFAHAGVIKALEELDINISKIIASSMGAVIGSRYAVNQDSAEVIQLVQLFTRDLHKYLCLKNGIKLKTSNLKAFFDSIYPVPDISKTKIPLDLVVAEFNTSDLEILRYGKLSDAVLASVSLPFLNKPVNINGKFYSDPGLISNFPIEFYSCNDGRLLGVNTGSTKLAASKKASNFIERLVKKDDIYHLIRSNLKLQHFHETQKIKERENNGIILNLRDFLTGFDNTDFHKSLEIVEAGYNYTISRKEQILKAVR